MARLDNKPEKGATTDFTVISIGACLAQTTDKKKPPCIVVAYATAKEIAFVCMPMPTKKLYDRKDFLDAVAAAEGVKNITYVGADGYAKDVYFCRADSGKLTDVVARDYENNHFEDGISEIFESNVKFSVTTTEDYAKKFGRKLNVAISTLSVQRYEKDSYEYAVINAYNACLLGRVFEKEELQIETKEKQRVKIEVRKISSQFVEQETLYIRPIFRQSDDCVDYYETEEFTFIDGTEVISVVYKIAYTNRFNDYYIMRK